MCHVFALYIFALFKSTLQERGRALHLCFFLHVLVAVHLIRKDLTKEKKEGWDIVVQMKSAEILFFFPMHNAQGTVLVFCFFQGISEGGSYIRKDLAREGSTIEEYFSSLQYKNIASLII